MDKILVHSPAYWFLDHSRRAFGLVEAGNYEVGSEPPVALWVEERAARMLVAYMREQGYLKPEMPWDRTEDVKIIHRLLDLLSSRGKEAST